MSASSKKKLRNEQNAAKMTEKQLAQQKEDKKLKLYTGIFVGVVALFLVIGIFAAVTNVISSSGIREKNTVAVTIGENKLSNAELNYYYIDAINNFYSNYGSYASMLGMDVTKALDEQYYDEEAGQTWADYFLSSAKDNARSVYAMADAAKAANHQLSESEVAAVNNAVQQMELYGMMYGYEGDGYLKAMYGNGASAESYRNYVELSVLADSYYAAYGESLSYDDAALREAEAENYAAYSSYTFNSYYLSADKFLTGGTTAEDGTVSYSDEEKAASVTAAKEAAEQLIAGEIASVEEFDLAIGALSINEGSDIKSTSNEDYGFNSISELQREWVTDSARVEGDMTVIENSSTSTDAEGNDTTNVSGYYVLYWIGCNDNTFPLKNVRHILVGFEHDHEAAGEHDHSSTSYTDEEKAAALAEAEAILNEWKSGEASESSFADLANAKSDDGDGTTGGLYEDVFPGQMVAPFEDWCYDASRMPGDTGIVESTYGYHVMYFVGDSETNYRDFLISNALASEELAAWYAEILEGKTIVEGNTNYIDKDLVLGAAG